MTTDDGQRGEGYVYLKPGSRYYHAQWYVDGVRHRKTGQW